MSKHLLRLATLGLLVLACVLLSADQPALAQDDDVVCEDSSCGPIDTGDGDDTITVRDGGVVSTPWGLTDATAIQTGMGLDSVLIEDGGAVVSTTGSNASDRWSAFASPVKACGVGGLGATSVDNFGEINSYAHSTASAGASFQAWETASAGAWAWNQGFGIETSDGSDLVANWDTIVVQASSQTDATALDWMRWMSDANASTFAYAASEGTGMLTRDGDDIVDNMGTLAVVVYDVADSYASAVVADADAIGHGDAAAVGYGMGIDAGLGEDSIRNQGDLMVNVSVHAMGWSEAEAYSPVAWLPDADAVAMSHVSASADAIGICARDDGDPDIGPDLIINDGSLSVFAQSSASASASADAMNWWFVVMFPVPMDASTYAESYASAFTRATGILAEGAADIATGEDSWIDVYARAGTYSHSDAGMPDGTITEWTASADAFSYATATGMELWTGEHNVWNEGDLYVTSEAWGMADAGYAWWTPEYSQAFAYAAGIRAFEGEDDVANFGTIDVGAFAWSDTYSSAEAWGIDVGTWAYFGDDEDPLEIFDDDDVYNDGFLDVLAAADGSGWLSNSFATGIATRFGHDSVVNDGELLVTAYSSNYNWGDTNATAIGIDTGVYGIVPGEEGPEIFDDDTVANLGILDVRAAVDGDSYYGWANATGIQTGMGHDLVTNEGILNVRAENPYGFAFATGIHTGEGNDLVVNRGIIDARNVYGPFVDLGIAIDTGEDDDAVLLDRESLTIGNVELGDGDDLMTVVGNARMYGQVRGGSGWDTLFLDEVGVCIFDETPIEMEQFTLNQGTMEVLDDFTLVPEGLVQTTVSGDGTYGRIVVDGYADLMSGSTLTEEILAPSLEVTTLRNASYYDGQTFDLVLADWLGGSFGDVTLPNQTMFLDFNLDYVDLNADNYNDCAQLSVDVVPFMHYADNTVEKALATALDRIVPDASGDISLLIGTAQFAETGFQVDQAFAALSPDVYDGMSRTSFDSVEAYQSMISHRVDTLRDHARPARYNPTSGMRTSPVSSGFWASGLGQFGEHDPDAGFKGFDYTITGATLGYDRLMEKAVVGGNVGAAATSVDLERNFGEGDIDTNFASVYFGYFTDRSFIQSTIAFADHSYENTRNVIFSDVSRAASSDFDGDSTSLRLKGGLDYGGNRWVIEPFAALWYSTLDEDAFRETGAGAANVVVDNRSTDAMISDLGVRVTGDFEGSKGRLVPEFLLAWNHDFEIDDRTLIGQFEGVPGAPIVIDGETVGTDGANLGLGFAFMSEKGWSTSVRYDGRVRDNLLAHGFIGDFRLVF